MASRIFTHLVLVLGLFSAVSLKAQQVTFTISPSMVTPAVGDTVRLNVVVTNFTNIISFQYAMDWDANLFQFVTIDNKDNMPDKQNLDFNNYTPSAVIVGWSAVGGAQRSAPNGTVIYRLNLKVKAASSNYWAKFTGDGTSLEVIQAGQSVTPVFGNLGNPPGGASTALTVKTSTHSIQANQNVCVGVTADNFNNIEVAQWQMKWDSTVLRFDSLTKMNTTLGLSVGSHFGTTQAVTNGRLYFSWNSTPPKTVPNGDTLYKICFKGIGTVGTSTPVSTLLTNSEVYRSNSGSSTLIAITPQNGTVNIAAPTTTTGLTFSGTTVSGNIGDTVCVKVYVKNFKDIAIAGFSMHWDSTKLSFGKAHILNPQFGPQDSLILPSPTTTTTYSSPNNVFVYKTTASGSLVMFADLSGLNNGNGVTLLGDSSLVFDVCLRINSGTPGSSFPFTFNGIPFKVQILDKDVNKIPVTFVSGNININNVVVPAIVASGSVTNANCKNSSDGSVTLTVSGGTGTFGYSWSGPNFTATSKNITNLKAGKYYVTITSGSATPKVDSFTVTEPTIIATTKISTNVNCFGQATGSVILTPAGGTAPYTYAWSSGETSKDIANKAAGRYIVTVLDSKSCSIKDTTDITQPAAAISLTNAVTNVTCNGASTGAINLTVAGGTAAYTYSWTGPNGFTASTEDISNLKAGGYSVTVQDSKSCAQTMGPITVTEPAAITATPSVTSATCGQLNGAINITPAGGTAPYTYKWTGPNGYTSTSQNITGLAAGSYSVEITDAASCKMTLSAISVSSANPTFSLTNVVTNVLCNSGSTGAIVLTVTGGNGNFAYAWTGLNSFTATTKNISNIKAGAYNVDVTENGTGCKVVASAINVTEPTALTISQPQKTDVKCKGGATGTASISASGGTGSYTYSWTGPNGFTASNTSAISTLIAGTYSVVVKDANNCSATTSVTIGEPSTGIAIGTPSVTNVLCKGSSTGSIVISVQGGTSPYTFAWSNGSTQQNLSNIAAGTYTVTATDANSCTVIYSSIPVIEPTAVIAVTPSVTNASCGQLNGAINITPSGGTAPYSFKWTGPNGYTSTSQNIANLAAGSYTVEIIDASACKFTSNAITVSSTNATFSLTNVVTNVLCNGSNNGSIVLTVTGGNGNFAYAWTGLNSFTATTKNISNIKAGAYNVDVTENGTGCKVVASAINVTEPTALTISQPQKTDVKCKGGATGTASISASGGTGSYTYSWTGPNGFTASNTSAISTLIAGTYSVVVKDANNCSATTSVTIGEPSTGIAIGTPSVTNVLCKGSSTGSIVISVQGGTSPYTFAWSNGSTQQNLSNIAAGTYTVTATDANSCTVIYSSIPVIEPTAVIAVTPSVTNASCGQLNGAINITPSGGTAPYSFKWTGPNGYTSTSQNIANLAAGSYTVEIIDASACKFTSNAITVSSTNATFSLTNVVTNVLCNGSNNGSIVLTVTGGNGNFAYAWTGLNAFTATTKDISNLKAGSYNVNVTENGTGCQVAASAITVAEPAVVSISVTQKTDVKCKDDTSGSISINAAGGNGGFNYSWSGPNGFTASNTTSISNLKAGTYTVTVTDSKGCTANTSVTIIEPSTKVTIGTPSVVNVLCNGATTGSINITVQGGTAPYTFAWSNGSTQQNLNNIAAGNYVVTATDANGCKDTKSIDVTQPSALIISGTTSNSVIGCVGTITLSVTGGVPPYSYSWVGNGVTNPNAPNQTNLCPNEIYTVTVKDVNNCISTKQFTITGQIAPPIRLTDSTVVSQAGCPGQNFGAINIAFTGGRAPFSFEWMNFSGAIIGRDQNIKNLVAGKYRIKIIDMVGQSYLSGEIEVFGSLSTIDIGVTSISPESCIGGDGDIKLSVTGGTPSYTYVWNDGATSRDRPFIKAGTYGVTVSDTRACQSSKEGFIVKKTPCSLTLSSANKPANCFGDKNGSITINIQNGEPTYVIRWSANDSVRINNLPRRDGTYEIKNLAAGTYVISITDGNGQMTTITEMVKEPNEIVISKTVKNDAGNCSGSIVLGISGGTGPYSYIWNDGATSRDRFNLCANNILSVQVTDSKGCFKSTANDTIKSMIEPTTCATIRINTNFDGFNLKCFGDKNGSASVVTVTDLSITSPFQYVWDNGETGPTSFQLAAGARTVRVLGANGRSCIANFAMKAPDEIKVNVISNSQGCSLETVVRGGVAPYSYKWSTPKADTSVKISGLTAQSKYFVIVKDKYGCTTDPGIGTVECQEYCLKGPGVLTPNDDGKNDKFVIQKCDYKNVRLQVFNRWGQLSYENNDYTDQWEGYSRDGKDGKELPEGVYMFIIRALQANGIEKIEKSTVSILRQ